LQTQFIGEHLLPGQLGHLFVILSFIASLFSAFCYFRSAQSERVGEVESNSWLRLARNGFIIHTAAVFAIFITMYYILTQHLFEYHYAWEHSSRALPAKYLLSCFWEGQQGSFLLWSIWHSVLGIIVMFTGKGLESRAMTVIALVQVCLATVLFGIYLPGGIQIGTSPFMLLRVQMQGAPIFAQANYMSMITDGNGLNPLLQNYWMVIHPPILFLGFASTLIPFAFIIAALWKGDYQQFIKPTLTWGLFSGAVLGTGIMMGGAWAYESLNFGGYWAWDPVENASLVPWMIMVAALHTLLIFRATGRSLAITLTFYVLSYIAIWYSTFLTRTGVLGNTSVHAFTGEGKSLFWHLLIFIAVFGGIGIALLAARWKKLPRVHSEEELTSREFWMFIGSFILLLSALQITFTTSIPVWSPLAKWITGKDVAPPVNPVAHYNNIQIWVVMFISVLSAKVLYLKFKHTDVRTIISKLIIVLGIATALSFIVGYTQKIDGWQFIMLLFCCCFSIVANVAYVFFFQKSFKKMGPAMSHFGFGLLLLGILITGHKKEVISLNTLGGILPLGKTDMREAIKESQENVMLYKDVPVAMNDYWATYKGDSTSSDDPRTFYKVVFERKDTATNKILESFALYPDAFINPKGQQGLIANPSSKHYWNKDIFTYVSSVSQPAKDADTVSFKSFRLHKGDSVFLSKGFIVFNGFSTVIKDARYQPQAGDVAVSAMLDIYNLKGKSNTANPIYYIRDKFENHIEDTLNSEGAIVRLAKIIPEDNAAEIEVKEIDPSKNFVVLKAIVFPHINMVWLGTIVMVLGFLLSMWNTISKKKRLSA
jgi:cytochrome c-type biogenesis protein CcmF